MQPDGPELNLSNSLLAFLPIAVLLVSILALKWSAPKAGALAWLTVAGVAFTFFGADAEILAIASTKGLGLSLFVLAIIWSAVLLYNVLDRLGGIQVIGTTMTHLVGDSMTQALVVGWAFSGFMQGVAGFGVPVAVVTPLLVLMGFPPVRAVAIVLVGHAWAVTFGSLGSSYYTIQLVTGLEGDVIGPHMAAMFALPIILTGFAVAHLEGGFKSVSRGAPTVFIMGGAMSLSVWCMAYIGAAQIGALVPGLIGCGVGWALSRARLFGAGPPHTTPPVAGIQQDISTTRVASLGFHMAFLPYYLVILLSIISQLPKVKSMVGGWYWGLDYPAIETSLGFIVDAQQDYATIRFLQHPASLILFALVASYLVYVARNKSKKGTMIEAIRLTYVQSVSSSVGIGTIVMMALIMANTGMTGLLGNAIATATETAFAILSPFIGVLGTFMTGSNTNSNVMFGALQSQTADTLGIGPVTIASAQSIGGSLGSAIAPAKVLVGTTIVGLAGRESEVLRRTIPYCLGIVLLVGIEAWVLVHIFSAR